jgi:hypothetical protein
VGRDDERGEPTPHGLPPTASVVRNVVFLTASGEGQMARGELLDISGRKVLDLHPGMNDVSRLSPGVYFVRERSAVGGERAAVSGERSAVRKVLVVR